MKIVKYWRREYYKRTYYKYNAWAQPTLTSNGTLGGSSFATSESTYYTESSGAAQQAWRMFSAGTSDEWQINSISTSTWYWAIFYNPIPLRISEISVRDSQGAYSILNYQLQGSNDNSSWVTLATGVNNSTAENTSWIMSIAEGSRGDYKYHRLMVQGRTTTALMISRLTVTATYPIDNGTAEDYAYYVDSAGTAKDYTYYTDIQVTPGDSYNVTTETEVSDDLLKSGNILFGQRLFGRFIFAGSIKIVGSGGGEDQEKYLPDVFKIIAYNSDGTKSAIFGAGGGHNAVSEFNFKNIETGCGDCTIKFNKLPTTTELNYKQRVDIHLFNDNQPWFSGYVITRPIVGTTETSFSFVIHGFYNLLEKVQIFETYENMEASEIVKAIAKIVEKKLGLVYNTDKIINTGYTITKIVFDGVNVKDALDQLADFGLDYVYGVDEKRSIYFKPRNTEVNEQARFWVGKHLTSYAPTWNVEKVVNWAKIKGAAVDDTTGESWLATVEDTTSQATYGLQEDIWTLPSAYTAADAERWGTVQLQKYKDPIKSAKIKGVDLRYPNADGTFNVRKLSTDGECVVTTLEGSSFQYPITSLKYTVSSKKGIQCEMELGEQPFKIDTYFAKLDRDNKNNELLQQASNKQLAV